MASPDYYQPSYFGSPGYPPPYDPTACSLPVCTPFCLDWCYPLPPPPPFAFLGHQSDPNLSPLVIAIIGILASAFLLVSYYTVVAKYCTRSRASGRRPQGQENDSSDEQQSLPNESWPLVTVGLEESVIRSIPVCKYKRGDGLVDGTDCSVCLSEFQEDDSLRLLPKCSHAFHLPCIDTWLQSHSNCPLCRAHILSPAVPPPAETVLAIPAGASDPAGAPESQSGNHSEQNSREGPRSSSLDGAGAPASENDGKEEEIERVELGEQLLGVLAASHVRALSDLASRHRRDDIMVELRGELQPIRRSVSMDSSHRICISIADLLGVNPDLDDGNAGALEQPRAACSGSSERKSLGCEELVFKACNKHLHGCHGKSKGKGLSFLMVSKQAPPRDHIWRDSRKEIQAKEESSHRPTLKVCSSYLLKYGLCDYLANQNAWDVVFHHCLTNPPINFVLKLLVAQALVGTSFFLVGSGHVNQGNEYKSPRDTKTQKHKEYEASLEIKGYFLLSLHIVWVEAQKKEYRFATAGLLFT